MSVSSRSLFWLRWLLLVGNQLLFFLALRLCLQVFWSRAVIPESERFDALEPARFSIARPEPTRRPIGTYEPIWSSLRENEVTRSLSPVELSPVTVEPPVVIQPTPASPKLELCGAGFSPETGGRSGGFFRLRVGGGPIFVRIGETIPGTNWTLLELRERDSVIEAGLINEKGERKILRNELQASSGGN